MTFDANRSQIKELARDHAGRGSVPSGIADTTTAEEFGFGTVHTTTINFSNTPITMTDESGVVLYGGVKAYDMPAGRILFLGASADMTLTTASGVSLAAWEGDFGVGTVTASSNATLASTEQNIIPTTAIAAATTYVGDAAGGNAAAIAPLDGTSTAVDVYVNFLIDEDAANATGAGTIDGDLTLHWVWLGDK